MKTIRVVAAVIRSEDKIFATARGYGEFKGQWEFPGGKIEPGETPQEALVREIQEELDVKTEVGDLIDTIEYDSKKQRTRAGLVKMNYTALTGCQPIWN